MARRILSREARLIPNFNMTKPWSAPMTQEEQEATASSALLAGIADTDRAVTLLLSQFAGDYVRALGQASPSTQT